MILNKKITITLIKEKTILNKRTLTITITIKTTTTTTLWILVIPSQ